MKKAADATAGGKTRKASRTGCVIWFNTYINICNRPVPEIKGNIRDGLLDIGIITSSDLQKDDTYIGKIIYSYKDIVVAGKDFESHFKKPIDFAGLLDFPIIGFGKGTETYALYDQMFAERGMDTRVDIEVTSHEQSLSFIKNNMGITSMPEPLARQAIKEGAIIEVKTNDTIPVRHISIIRNESTQNNSAAVLEDYIIRYAANFQKQDF